MSARLAEEHCSRVARGAAALSEAELARLLEQLPDWRVGDRKGVACLERTFRFPDFASALAFANRVGADADAEDHHPELVVEWGRVTVAWWTHVVGGLHRNDAVMAARTDEFYAPTTS